MAIATEAAKGAASGMWAGFPGAVFGGTLGALGSYLQAKELKKQKKMELQVNAADKLAASRQNAAQMKLQGQQDAYNRMMQAYQAALGGY